MKYFTLLLSSLFFLLLGCRESEAQTKKFPVAKTEAEWKSLLNPEQYYILREKGTERPGTGKLLHVKGIGQFICAACRQPLFTTSTKFESGTGWPSFYAPITKEAVYVSKDNSLGMSRDEVVCSRCGGHLGHVFDDGPPPTGLRYCMNSEAMLFEKK